MVLESGMIFRNTAALGKVKAGRKMVGLVAVLLFYIPLTNSRLSSLS